MPATIGQQQTPSTGDKNPDSPSPAPTITIIQTDTKQHVQYFVKDEGEPRQDKNKQKLDMKSLAETNVAWNIECKTH